MKHRRSGRSDIPKGEWQIWLFKQKEGRILSKLDEEKNVYHVYHLPNFIFLRRFFVVWENIFVKEI
jgi:hypothetical protein